MQHRSRTPAEAVEHYRGQTVRLLSCVTTAHTTVGGYHASELPHRLSLSDGDPAPLRGEPHLTLDVTEQFRVFEDADGWRVEIVGYLYALEYEDHELVAYHWHPRGESPITWPHMHIGADIRVGDRWLGKIHLPSGPVGLERIVAVAIAELGAEPLRDDWERLIREAGAQKTDPPPVER
jgi:hypothetical protein